VIDLRILRDDPDRVRAAQAKRGAPPELVDRLLDADRRRRASIADYERLRA
jgi:seryl-tRNA synthetase